MQLCSAVLCRLCALLPVPCFLFPVSGVMRPVTRVLCHLVCRVSCVVCRVSCVLCRVSCAVTFVVESTTLPAVLCSIHSAELTMIILRPAGNVLQWLGVRAMCRATWLRLQRHRHEQ
jgi:hypothetical protein